MAAAPQPTATASPTVTDTPVIPTEEPTVVEPTETPVAPTETPADTPVPPEETPIVEPTSEPATPVLQPLISVTPASGGYGTTVTVTGSGFPVNVAVNITLTDANGALIVQTVSGWQITDLLTTQVLTTATNENGDFAVSYLVPDIWLDGTAIVDGGLAFLAYAGDYSIAVTAPFTFTVTE